MIKRLTGMLGAVEVGSLELTIGPVVHEVLVPELVRRDLQTKGGQSVTLHTLEFLEGTPGRGNLVPRLVGFLSEVEREFFDLICEVDGVGVRKALRAMVRPVGEIARAIEEQDAAALSTLPGIGAATAERMIAKLRRRMPKFALLVARDTPSAAVQAAYPSDPRGDGAAVGLDGDGLQRGAPRDSTHEAVLELTKLTRALACDSLCRD
jgi:Holliday junction DNA helicase RuvA